MNINKLANIIKNSNYKYGEYYSTLLYKWPLLIIFPMLTTLMVIGYLKIEADQYVATASFGKVSNLDDDVNLFFIKNLSIKEINNFSKINECISKEFDTTPENLKPKLKVLSIDKNSYSIQLSINSHIEKNAINCANQIFSTILYIQYNKYLNFITENNELLLFYKNKIDKSIELPQEKFDFYQKIEKSNYFIEKAYQLDLIKQSNERIKNNGFMNFEIKEEYSKKIWLLLSNFLLSILLVVVFVLRNLIILETKSFINNGFIKK